MNEENDLTRRALAAYFRAGSNIQPGNNSGVKLHDGKQYVILRNVREVLAVYRVRNNGVLKGLRRWPSALNKDQQKET